MGYQRTWKLGLLHVTLIQSLRSNISRRAGPKARGAARSVLNFYRIHALRRNAPSELRSVLTTVQITSMADSLKVKRHRMFQVGSDRVLHLYDPRISPIRRALADRLLLGSVDNFRVPTVHVHLDVACNEYGARQDTVWLLEDRLDGASLDTLPETEWQAPAISGLLRLAQRRGPRLSDGGFWHAHAGSSIAAAPEALRPAIADAWRDLRDIAAAPVHGDVQPKNCVAGKTIGLVDWEGFWLGGLPGIDLAFLAVMAGRTKPDVARFALLVRRECPFATAIESLGLKNRTYRAALLAMLAIWNKGEERRLARDQGTLQPRPFRDLLLQFGTGLGSPRN